LNNKDFFKNIFAKSVEIALGILLAAVVIGFVFYISCSFFKPKLEALTRPIMRTQVSVQITTKEKQLLDALVDKGAVSAPQEVMSQIISFYDTQNAFLLGIMALSGLFGFFYIRQKTKSETEAILKSEFETFTKMAEFQTKINAIVDNSAIIIELKETADDLYERLDSLNVVEEKADGDDQINSGIGSNQPLKQTESQSPEEE